MGDCVPFLPDTESEAGLGWRETPALRRARVLLVDDSRHDVLLAKRYLVDSGGLDCDLVCALSAQEAMDILLTAQTEGWPIDLILLDISMPGDSGFTLLTRIRDHPVLRRIQVIMCTGSSLDLDRHRARHLGIVGYMVKPPSPEKLLDIVQALPLFDIEEDGGGARLMTVLSDGPA